ncbi:MAG: polysaccharide deacetylase family protein, partial [Promethearchaeota archaeon]
DTYFGVKVGLLKILKILDTFKIKGTFFCTGRVAEQLPESIRLIECRGHEIACHGLNHERLTNLTYQKCYETIQQSKRLIERICQKSEITGFRAPYLRPPKYLFKILNNLGFKYDSSIKSAKQLKNYHINNYQIQEFHPSEYSIFFRVPLSYYLLRKKIFKENLVILYFHPWEAVNMKNLVLNQTNVFSFLKNVQFRPDRWVNTGNKFTARIINFIREAISNKAKFSNLKQLLIEREKLV